MAHGVLLGRLMFAPPTALAPPAAPATSRGLPGLDLRQVLATQGPLPVAVAIDVILQACHHLAAAHANGVAHGDLSPATVRWVDGGRPVVHLASPGQGGGAAPGYAAPERLLGTSPVGPRADVFALGALAYELVTGRPAFPSDPGAFVACLHEGIPAMGSYAWVPASFEQVVFRCMSPSEDGRFSDARELGMAMMQLRAELAGQVATPGEAFGPLVPVPPAFSSSPPPVDLAPGGGFGSGLRDHWPLVVLPPVAVMLAMALVHVLINGR